MSGKTFVRRRGSTAIPNATVHDARLSYVALGILTVILAQPERAAGNGYRAYLGRGAGQAAVLNAFKELDGAGYRWQFKRKGKGGKFATDTIVSETPMTQLEAEAYWAKKATVSDNSRTAKTVDSSADLRSPLQGSPRTVDRAWSSTASSVPEDQGSLTASLKEPVIPKGESATPMRWCLTCDRLRSEDQLTVSGVCFDCLPEPLGASPEVGSGRALFRATVDALRASKAAQTTSEGQALPDQRKRA